MPNVTEKFFVTTFRVSTLIMGSVACDLLISSQVSQSLPFADLLDVEASNVFLDSSMKKLVGY